METSGPRYTMLIQWSEPDHCYVVTLPEWGPYCSASGVTYEEAAKNGHDVLDLLLDTTGDPAAVNPPVPNLYRGETSLVERFVNASRENARAVEFEKQPA